MRVPDFIYKVVLDETPPRKMIAFIAPNRDTKKKPWQLAVTVDEVEEATGLDFFWTMEKDEQERLESAWDLRLWFAAGRERRRGDFFGCHFPASFPMMPAGFEGKGGK